MFFLSRHQKPLFIVARVMVMMTAALALPTSAFALPDFLQPANIANFFKKQVAKQSIGLNLNLYNIELANGVTTALKYRYEAEPSYIDSYYTRYDIYKVENELEPSAWVDHFGGPFTLGLTAGSDMIFVRQFRSQKEAAFAAPYLPNRLPISANRALEQLSPGDFVSFQSYLNLTVKLEDDIARIGAFSISGATHALISGNFLVHLYKVDSTHVRVKFISLHNGGAGVSVGIKPAKEITLIAMKIGSKDIEKAWNVNLGSFSRDYDLSNLFMLDYVLDLADPRVAKAYDDLMQKKALLKSVDMFYPVVLRKSLQSALVTDFSEFEKLYREELGKSPKDRVINRLFKGSTLTSTLKNHLSFNISAFKFDYQTFFARNQITTFNSDEKPLYYLFDTFSTNYDRRLPFHIKDKSEKINSNLLFTSSSDFKPVQFVGLFMNRELRTQSLSEGGFNDIRKNLKTILPKQLYSQIPLDRWDISTGEAVNVYFRNEIYFPMEALHAMPILDAAGLKRRYQDFLNALPEVEARPTRSTNPNEANEVLAYDDNTPTAKFYDRDLNIISKQLAISFDPKTDPAARHEAFLKLKNNDLFVETGAGFLIYLLPQDRLNQLLGYSLTLTGKDQEGINFHFGVPTQDELYRSMLYIQDLLNSRSVDLRLLQDTEKTTNGLKAY